MTDQQIDEFLEMLAKSPTSARDMVRGLFSAHEAKAAPAVPKGWKLVPVEMTDEMRDAGNEFICNRWLLKSAYAAMLAATPAAPSQPVTLTDEWISVDDQKPPTNKPVLIHYLNERQRSKIVRAHYIPAKTVEAGEDDAADEYDEESDTYFVQEGWYEDNSESEVNYGITGQITHWRNLPPVPAIIAALREKEGK